MRTPVILALRAVIVLVFLGAVAVQAAMVPVFAVNVAEARWDLRIPFALLCLLGALALQTVCVCVWRLLTMVKEGTVFSFGAFRFVDLIIGSIAIGAVVMFGYAVLAAYSNRTTPGDEIAPGVVGFMCVVAVVIAGVSLLVYVMRTLLTQAVALDDETKHLQAELREVI